MTRDFARSVGTGPLTFTVLHKKPPCAKVALTLLQTARKLKQIKIEPAQTARLLVG